MIIMKKLIIHFLNSMPHRSSCILLVGMLFFMLLAGCSGSGMTATQTAVPTTSVIVDPQLIGLWTNRKDRMRVELDKQGKPVGHVPVGQVPVGQWYQFNEDGTYYWVARHMTFAIGGVSVEEGRFTESEGKLLLLDRTESFFPDKGSTQKEKFRSPIADGEIYFRLASEYSEYVLMIKTGVDQPEVAYRPCEAIG
jgi:hypothetical protein